MVLQVANSPPDSVSCLKFAPGKDFFAASSWDNSCYVYQYMKSGMEIRSSPVLQLAANTHSQGILSHCWSPDAGKIFTGSVDKTGERRPCSLAERLK